MVCSSSMARRWTPVLLKNALLWEDVSLLQSSTPTCSSTLRPPACSGDVWGRGTMETVAGASEVFGVLMGEWTIAGPSELPLRSAVGKYFPVTVTPFLLPRLIPGPSVWSSLLLWKTHQVCQNCGKRRASVYEGIWSKIIKTCYTKMKSCFCLINAI